MKYKILKYFKFFVHLFTEKYYSYYIICNYYIELYEYRNNCAYLSFCVSTAALLLNAYMLLYSYCCYQLS